jgi:hypothetical protein
MTHLSSSLSGFPHQIGSVDPVRLLSIMSTDPNSGNPNPGSQLSDGDHGLVDPMEDQEYSQKFRGGHAASGGWKRASHLKEQNSVGLFGSLLTTTTPYYVNGPSSLSAALALEYQKEKRNFCSKEESSAESKGEEEIVENDVTSSLLAALAPMRDRYLTSSLNKMNEPVLQVSLPPALLLDSLLGLQMFSESEGYSAAIPSRRDLQTLVKVIQDEVASVVIERSLSLPSSCRLTLLSDRGLVKIIGR